MYGYVYITHDVLKNKVYVGQHKSETYDKNYFGSGLIIKNIIKKRKDTLKNYVLEWCETKDALDESEIRWIAYFKEEFGEENSYNISNGAQGGILGDFHREAIIKSNQTREITKEQLEKTKKTCLEKYGCEYAVQSIESRKKNRDSHLGKKATIETRQKMSESRKGENSYWFGKHLSEESRQKISESKREYYKTHEAWNKGKKGLYKRSEESRQKMSESRKGKPKKKFYWKTHDGDIKIMAKANVISHHPDWVLIGPVE